MMMMMKLPVLTYA